MLLKRIWPWPISMYSLRLGHKTPQDNIEKIIPWMLLRRIWPWPICTVCSKNPGIISTRFKAAQNSPGTVSTQFLASFSEKKDAFRPPRPPPPKRRTIVAPLLPANMVHAVHMLGHYASTRFILTKAGVPNILSTEARVEGVPNELRFADDAKLRFQESPAGTHRMAVCYEAAKRLSKYQFAHFCPQVSDFTVLPGRLQSPPCAPAPTFPLQR
jgi:hypothetical protein